jgi:catechol 2,3-dioxygenase-like lactoylglutathione lyase family enzyme
MPPLNAIGIAASDMAESIRFYRALGLDMPETPDEGHVVAVMPDGGRLMLDSEEITPQLPPRMEAHGRKTRSRSPSNAGARRRSTR